MIFIKNKKITVNPSYIEKQLMKFDYDIKTISHLETTPNRKSATVTVSNFRLVIFISGLAKVRMLGNEYYLRKGDCALFSPGSLYNAVTLDEGNCKMIILEFSFYSPINIEIFSNMLGLKDIAIFPNIIPNSIIQEAISIYKEFDNQNNQCAYKSRLLLENIIGCIVFRSDSTITPLSSNNLNKNLEEIVTKFYEYIINNKDKNIRIEDACTFLNISRSHIYECVKNYTGISAKDFLIQIKMNLARQDILTTNKSITQIAAENGYSTQNHFSSLFKKVHNISPSQYRNENKAP